MDHVLSCATFKLANYYKIFEKGLWFDEGKNMRLCMK